MNLTDRNSWWFRVFVAGSCLLNVLIGGQMYESMCARAWRSNWRPIIWIMNLIEKDHCRKAHIYHKKIMKGLKQDANLSMEM